MVCGIIRQSSVASPRPLGRFLSIRPATPNAESTLPLHPKSRARYPLGNGQWCRMQIFEPLFEASILRAMASNLRVTVSWLFEARSAFASHRWQRSRILGPCCLWLCGIGGADRARQHCMPCASLSSGTYQAALALRILCEIQPILHRK